MSSEDYDGTLDYNERADRDGQTERIVALSQLHPERTIGELEEMVEGGMGEPHWWQVKLQFLDNTDWDTVNYLRRLENLNVRVYIKGRGYRERSIVSVSHYLDHEPGEIDRVAGMLFAALDEGKHNQAPLEFVPFEDIEEIGIY